MANVRGQLLTTGEYVDLSRDEMLNGVVAALPVLIGNWMKMHFTSEEDTHFVEKDGEDHLLVKPEQLMDLAGAAMMCAPDVLEQILQRKLKAADAAGKGSCGK